MPEPVKVFGGSSPSAFLDFRRYNGHRKRPETGRWRNLVRHVVRRPGCCSHAHLLPEDVAEIVYYPVVEDTADQLVGIVLQKLVEREVGSSPAPPTTSDPNISLAWAVRSNRCSNQNAACRSLAPATALTSSPKDLQGPRRH